MARVALAVVGSDRGTESVCTVLRLLALLLLLLALLLEVVIEEKGDPEQEQVGAVSAVMSTKGGGGGDLQFGMNDNGELANLVLQCCAAKELSHIMCVR